VVVRIALTICVGIWPLGFGQVAPKSKAMAPPALPFYEAGVCPGEFRCYGDPWTVPRAMTVYDTYKDGRRAVAQLAVGDSVTPVTGVVITFKPGRVRMDRDLPDQGLRLGDTILTYAHRGEGYAAVWFKGRYFPDFDLTFEKLPDGSGCGNGHCAATRIDFGKHSWWAEVKLVSGRMGWVDMELGKDQQ
jgi:hypothetical protein